MTEIDIAELGDVRLAFTLAGDRLCWTRSAGTDALARKDHDCWDRLPELSMPVLLAAGRYDGIAPPANQHATLEWFDGGHAFFVEDRSAYPRMIDFLGG